MPPISHPSRAFVACVLLAAAIPAFAQTVAVTDADYARAAKLLGQNATPLIDHAIEPVHWIDARTFWYRDHDAGGDRFLRVDAATGDARPAFDQARLARALGKARDKTLRADHLPIDDLRRGADGREEITSDGKRYLCDLAGKGACTLSISVPAADDAKPSPRGREPGALSPDRKQEAFISDWNLWVRDLATGADTQLTHDGAVDHGYATDNAGWKHTDNAIVLWSPDGTKIATFRQDQRRTGDMVLVATNIGTPRVETWKYPLVGDAEITMIERVIVDVPSKQVLRLKMPPDQHRSTLCDDVSCDGGWEDVQWAPDGRTLAFASSSRDHRQVWLRIADVATGEVRTVFDEKARTWFDSGIGAVSWRYLAGSNEILWFSQRSNWGHLYLYDAGSGKLKRAVTRGDWNVSAVLRVDPASRTVWFIGLGREAGRNPYYRHFYKASLDGGDPVLLSPEDADHTISLAPGGASFVDTWSTTTTPPVSALRRAEDGGTIKELARADIARLQAAGWTPPEPFTVKGRDGRTDLYGLMFKPSNFDPAKKYPIVDYIYPGPQIGSVRSRSFLAAHGDNQSLAELGFIVVAVDGMGTPSRSKAFHDTYHADIGDNTLPDQVAALRELGARHAWIDLDRVGIWGHSGGGNATATAMFRYPELFKVGIAESGNHDNRNYEDDWAEKWQGLLKKDKDGRSNYDDQANQNHVAGLEGHLLLVHGTMDDNVPPSNTLLVVDALIRANKDFDLLMIPNARHGYGTGDAARYVIRRRWDYFVRHLLGAQPPRGYALPPFPE